MIVLLGALVVAQDFRGQQGGNRRDGRPTLSASTPALLATEATFNNPGRGFLRWWSPAREAEARMDNDESLSGTITGTSAPLNGTWTTPAAIGAIDLAFNYDQESIGTAPYRLARTTAQTLNTTDETSGSTAAYRWRFTNLTPGVEYQLFVNMPIGPTAPGFPANANDFPQRHFVYEIEGAVGGDDIQVVDLFLFGGGQVPLGSGGDVTTRTYVPTGTELSIVLHNTTPRSSQGSFLDPQAAPGQEWVYADSATIQTMVDGAALGSSGVTVAELALAPPSGASALDANFNNRAVYARNEEFILGETGETHPIGMVNSFTYDGTVVNLAGAPSRLNKAWTFPVAAEATTAAAETARVNRDTRDWLLGPETAFSRNRVRHVRDDLLASSLISGTDFVRQTPAVLPFTSNGPSWVESPVRPTSTSTVAYDLNVPDGFYLLQVWIPPDDSGATLTREARYRLQRGVTVVDTFTLDQSVGNGWVTLPGQPSGGYEHINGSGELRLTVSNAGPSSETGRIVYADAIRLIGSADLSVTATPAFVQMQVPDAGPSLTNRDVVIVPSEDGKIRALDAHGDRTTGTTTQYWVYPPENAVDFADTNRAARNGGVAEEPTGFGKSAPAVARMSNGRDYVFAASKNGRVYALTSSTTDSAGVERAWTWPNDYNPASPTSVGLPAEADEIVSSVVIAPAAAAPSGQVVIVALQSGRIVALDAQGVAGENRTTIVWQITGPAPGQVFGGFTTTPVISESGDLVFGAEETTTGTGMIVAVDVNTGVVNWTLTSAGGNSFGTFTHGGGTTAPFGFFAGGRTYFVDDNGLFVAVDSAGNDDFSFLDPTVVPGAPLQTTFLTAFNSSGVQTANTLAVMIPTQGGQLVAYHGENISNLAGGRRIWQDNFEGQGLPSSIAVGGKRVGELRSWMYAADSEGYLYAYNGNDDVNPAPISPGVRPGREVIVENDPADGELDSVLDSTRLHIVSWTTYTNIRTGLASGWTTAQVASAIAADRTNFTRRAFEVGESLYMVAYGLPDLTASSTGSYYIEFILKGPLGESRVSARTLSTATPNELACVWAIPLQVNGPLVPGENSITARAVPVARRNTASVQVGPQAPAVLSPNPNGDVFTLANPLAVGFYTASGAVVNSVGDTTDATAAQNITNGVTILDPGSNPGLRKEAGGGPALPGAYAGSNPFEFTGAVAHAGVGVSRMVVKDRSLSFLLFGTGRGRANATRGLPGVRMESGDLVWQVRDINGVEQADRNVVGALPAAYTNFEQPPNIEPNLSLDYPDINRGQLSGRRTAFGRSANPFLSDVSLDAPAFTDSALTAYRTPTGYSAQLTRTLAPSQFELQVNVPKYQPASGPENAPIADRRGYIGVQSVYVQARGESFDGTQANRQVSLGLRVAPDRSIRTTTPTLDLGSLPMGSGFDSGVGGLPMNPWNQFSAFRPWNGGQSGRYSQQFTEFTVLNEGNVNLQNLRVAKGRDFLNGFTLSHQPLFVSSRDTDLGMLEARQTLFTSLDPRWSETGPFRSNFDPTASVRLQKPRPGDPIGTILSTNPVRRQNPFTGAVAGSSLLDPTLFPIGNPRLGMAVPLGSPSGEYTAVLRVIEDGLNAQVDPISGLADVPLPALGPATLIPTRTDILEPYTDPGITLRFRVREARMTNGQTGRGAPLIDVSSPSGAFSWENAGSAVMRDAGGSVWTAYASNRQTDGSGQLLPRLGGDTPQTTNWRIFLSRMGSFLNTGVAGESPTRDLTQFISSSDRWFQRGLTLPNVGTPSSLFTVGAGQTVVAGSEQFHSPDLPSTGTFLPLQVGPIRTSRSQPFLAYLGTATVLDSTGQRSTIERVFLEQLQSVSATARPPIEINDGFGSRFSKPSVVQNGLTATVFYVASTGSSGQLRSTTVINGAQQPARSYSLGEGFSELGAPSASLRRYQNGSANGVIDLVLPAKRAGRSSNELFLGRLQTNAAGAPTGTILRYPLGLQKLEREGGQPVFFANAAAWSTAAADMAQFQLAMTDAGSPNGLRPLIRPGTVNMDRQTGLLRAQTTLGGEVTADVRTGRVQFTNAAIPVGRDLYVIVRPGLLLASEASGSAYRTPDSAFDDRLIPVIAGTTQIENDLSAVSYWYNEVGAGFRSTAPLAELTNDRLLVTASSTPAGTARTVRPVMKSMRFGVQLPFPIAIDPATGEPLVTVEWNQLGNPLIVPPASRRYQVDAAKGRIYLPAGAEDFNVVISYRAGDSAGNALGAIAAAIYPVTMINEMSERLVPIEQATNDVSLAMALDPPTAAYQNAAYRRPSLIWMAWTSTRAGVTDIYMQTVAPRFSILPPGG